MVISDQGFNFFPKEDLAAGSSALPEGTVTASGGSLVAEGNEMNHDTVGYTKMRYVVVSNVRENRLAKAGPGATHGTRG